MVIKKIIDSDPLPLPDKTSPLFVSLCDRLLNKDASLWPSIDEILWIPEIKERTSAEEEEEKKTSSGQKPNLVLDHGFSDEEEEEEYTQSSFLNQF